MTMNFGATRLSMWALFIMLAIAPLSANAAGSGPDATEFKLENGMQVVVIPDRRAPVVTHMVWYKVGAADEPKGVSGIAHFLEHLMFKSTDKIPLGEFSKIIARLGGRTMPSPAMTLPPTISAFRRTGSAPSWRWRQTAW